MLGRVHCALCSYLAFDSGPKRYDYNDATGEWFYSRDGHTFDGLLTEELSDIFKQSIQIRLNN